MKAEADAVQKLSETRSELEKYKVVYGDHSTLPPDASELAEQLKQKEDEIQRLRLLDTQRAQVRRIPFGIQELLSFNYMYPKAETSLYAELDKLSAAWEALDRQLKSKVFDLSAMEDRVNKIGLDVSFAIFDCKSCSFVSLYSVQNLKTNFMPRCETKKPLRQNARIWLGTSRSRVN